MKNTILKVIATIAYKSSQNAANSACVWYTHQPRVPEQLKKLKKN